VTLEIQEVEVPDDNAGVGINLRRLSEAGAQRHEIERDLMDLSVDGLGMPVLPREFSGWSATDGVRGL
jgi:hypothetical protein